MVADPLSLASDALRISLSRYSDFSLLEPCPETGPDAVAVAARLWPDVALVDYWMPELSGPDVTRAILEKAPNCMVVLLSWLSAPQHIQKALEAGAAGFISKDVKTEQLAEAIRRTLQGSGPLYAKEVQKVLSGRALLTTDELALFRSLTPRQSEILQLLDTARTSREIADALGISFKTVRNHISEILSKTQNFAAAEAVARAHRCGYFASLSSGGGKLR